MDQNTVVALWAILTTADRQRLSDLAKLDAECTKDLVDRTENVILAFCCRPPSAKRKASYQVALVRLLRSYEAIARLKPPGTHDVSQLLTDVLPPWAGSPRRRLLDVTVHLRKLVDPAKRGKPCSDNDQVSALAEELLRNWADWYDGNPKNIYTVGETIEFFRIILPKIAVPENRRTWSRSWEDIEEENRRFDWGQDDSSTDTSSKPKEPNAALADLIMEALPRAIRRLKRRAKQRAEAPAQLGKASPRTSSTLAARRREADAAQLDNIDKDVWWP